MFTLQLASAAEAALRLSVSEHQQQQQQHCLHVSGSVLQYPTATVLVSFNATAATAPILGVLGGGWFIDFVGGYKDERGMRRTMSVLLLWAVGCLLLGVGAGWSSNFWFIVFCMWCILFLGGGILPAATGIVIASVPVEVRAFGSGFCMMIYNVLGYVLGTFLPGILIEAASLLWGMRVSPARLLLLQLLLPLLLLLILLLLLLAIRLLHVSLLLLVLLLLPPLLLAIVALLLQLLLLLLLILLLL